MSMSRKWIEIISSTPMSLYLSIINIGEKQGEEIVTLKKISTFMLCSICNICLQILHHFWTTHVSGEMVI